MPSPSASECEVSLRVQVGAAKGRSIAIYGPKFVIGRDRSCHLRLGSAMVSKFHSAIELRDGRFSSATWAARTAQSSMAELCVTPRPNCATAIASRSDRSSVRLRPARIKPTPDRSRR